MQFLNTRLAALLIRSLFYSVIIVLPAVLLAENSFETAPTFKASQILPRAMMNDPAYKIEEKVSNNGYMNIYSLRTPDRLFRIEGNAFLELRINEARALAFLRSVSSSKVFLDAAKAAGVNLVDGTVKTVGKAIDTVTSPEKLEKTVRGIPDGVGRLFSFAAETAQSGVELVGGVAKSATGGSNAGAQDAAQMATAYGLNYLGYSGALKKWQRQLNIDPYTDNEELKAELRRVAQVESVVHMGSKFIPGIPGIGTLAKINKYTEYAEDLSAFEPPEILFKKNEERIKKLGIPSDTAEAFKNNKWLWPSTQAIILGTLEKMQAVEGLVELAIIASQVKSQGEALYVTGAIIRMNEQNRKTRFSKVVSQIEIPSAISADGTVYVPLPVDYLVWTKDMAGVIKGYYQEVIGRKQAKRIEVEIFGKISPLARQEIEKKGVKVIVSKQ